MADEVLTLDLSSLRVREVEEIEELLDCNIDEALAPGRPRGKVMRVIGYIVKKRDDPSFTMEQAGELVINLDDAPDPTPPSA